MQVPGTFEHPRDASSCQNHVKHTFQVAKWDLVVSGINRGDNLGLRVIYSGTVGAAREAACKAGPSRLLPN